MQSSGSNLEEKWCHHIDTHQHYIFHIFVFQFFLFVHFSHISFFTIFTFFTFFIFLFFFCNFLHFSHFHIFTFLHFSFFLFFFFFILHFSHFHYLQFFFIFSIFPARAPLGLPGPLQMFASKTAMQHVSKPNVLMHARLQRLGRYYEVKPVLVWCYPLQELPNGVRVDGDGDWAPTTELLRRSTSGGAVRYGLHTWDCYSVTQATIALSSAESEFYATGSATARGLQYKVYVSETERPCELDVHSASTAGRGMCQRTGVGKVRHLELRFLWIQERLRLKACRLNKETTEEMTADTHQVL